MRYRWLLLLGLPAACRSDPVTVRSDRVDNGMAHFVVVNHSDKDVKSIRFEVVFRAAKGVAVSVDTITYKITTDASTGKPTPFVRARDETFFLSRMPETAVSESGTVLSVEFVDSTEAERPAPS